MLRQTPVRRAVLSGKRWRFTSNVADVFALAIGLTATATVHFVGDLPMSEVILLAILPAILAINGRRVMRREFKILFSLLALWLAGQMISDMYRHTATLDWIRGDAAIIFFGLDLLGLAVLLRKNERRKAIFLTGIALGTILFTFLNPSTYAIDEPWKFGYATGVIYLTVLISCFFYARRMYVISALLIMGIAGVNLLENYRGPVGGLLLIIPLVFPIIPEGFGKLKIMPSKGGVLRVAVLLVLALGAVWTAGKLVDYVTSAGLISEEARAKNETEKKGGSLLGGRPEIQVSLQAVKDSPIVGYGSWPQDPKYLEMLINIQAEQGVVESDDMSAFETDYIPTHSHLMGAWVWAGILGAAFWFYILWLTVRATIRVALIRPPLAPIYAALVTGMFWQVMFSPFGLNARVYDAIAIVIMIDLLDAKPLQIKNVLVGVRRRIMPPRPRRMPNPHLFPTPR